MGISHHSQKAKRNGDGATRLCLPQSARSPINRCNLPAVILGSLGYQAEPIPLTIDGVGQLHAALFETLEGCAIQADRARHFCDYMTVHFRLDHPEEQGLQPGSRIDRSRADYLRLLRGWGFDSDGRDGAVLKGWVESRFGLLPRFHGGPISGGDSDNYRRYQHQCAAGLYNTNALEAQLDLLFSYCQYELQRSHPEQTHITLYRGLNGLAEHDIMLRTRRSAVLLLNNLNSFSSDEAVAGAFGDVVIEAAVPLGKLLYFSGLLPGRLGGEAEYLVLGGLQRVKLLS